MADGLDIFGYKRDTKPKAVFSTADASLTFGVKAGAAGASAKGALIQNWNINYQQQVTEVFELGSSNLYWVQGRPQGTGTIARIIGPEAKSANDGTLFPKEAFQVCNGGAFFKLSVGGGTCDSSGNQKGKVFKIEMDGCVVVSIGFQADINDTRLLENVQWRFAHLSINNP